MRNLKRTLVGTLLAMAGTAAASAPSLATDAAFISAPAAPIRASVSALGDKQCEAYFHDVSGKIRFPLVLSMKGTGVYTTARSNEVELALRNLHAAGKITVLTIDKPGIAAAIGSGPLVNDALYNRYVQEDLVRCAINALTFAARAVPGGGGGSPILFSGHSEGAQIAIKVLECLTSEGDPLAPRVKALFLSGLPLGDWRALLGAQLGLRDRRQFFLAFEQRDDAVLRTFGNLTTAYLTQVFAQEPLDQTLGRLAAHGTTAEFHVYQGLADRNTPAAAVRALERRNLQGPSLRLKASYYPTGHALSRIAVLDIARDIDAALGSLP